PLLSSYAHPSLSLFSFFPSRPTPFSTLFPYTTLFRSISFFSTSLHYKITPLLSPTILSPLPFVSFPSHFLLIFISFPFHFLPFRSEEHTSQLQSRFDLVCRLLLEKKKQIFSHLFLYIH